MSWLKLDDGFASNPKITALPEARRWRWVELLLDCARHSAQGGAVTIGMLRRVRLDPDELVELRLLDVEPQGSLYPWRVHDWDDFNARARSDAERQARYRERQKSGTSPAQLRRSRASRNVTEGVTDDVTVTSPVTEAPRPHPVPSLEGPDNSALDVAGRGGGWVDDLGQYTGCRVVRGEVGISHVYDPLGTERPPVDWPHARPTRQEILRAFEASEASA